MGNTQNFPRCTPEKAAAIIKTLQTDPEAVEILADMMAGKSLLGRGHAGRPARNRKEKK